MFASSAGVGGSTAAAADGSTLKVSAPAVIAPIGGARVQSLRPTLSWTESTGTYTSASPSYEVEVSEALLEKLVHAGFDPVYGARPLKRAIQQKVENPLAQALLSGRVIPGKTLRLGADSNGLTMSQP